MRNYGRCVRGSFRSWRARPPPRPAPVRMDSFRHTAFGPSPPSQTQRARSNQGSKRVLRTCGGPPHCLGHLGGA